MSFVPKIERTQEDIEKTLKGLLEKSEPRISSLPYTAKDLGIIEYSDRYMINGVRIDGQLRTIYLTKEPLRNGLESDISTWQTHFIPLEAQQFPQDRWQIPTLPNITQLIIGLYNLREIFNEEGQKNALDSLTKSMKGEFLTSTVYDAPMHNIIHKRLMNEERVLVHNQSIEQKKEILLGADPELFFEAASWLTNQDSPIKISMEQVNKTLLSQQLSNEANTSSLTYGIHKIQDVKGNLVAKNIDLWFRDINRSSKALGINIMEYAP